MSAADYSAAPYNVRLTQGDTFRETFVFRNADGSLLDLTGLTFASQVRETAAGAALATMTIDVTGAASGQVVRSLGTAVTAGLSGRLVHDLQQTDSDGVRRTLLGGEFTVVDEVTRG